MIDRVVQYPNRYRAIPVAGQENVFDFVPVLGTITTEGTPLNKATLLSDETATLYGMTGDNTTVNQALQRLMAQNYTVFRIDLHELNGTISDGIEFNVYAEEDTAQKTSLFHYITDGTVPFIQISLPNGAYVVHLVTELPIGYLNEFRINATLNEIYQEVHLLQLGPKGTLYYIKDSGTVAFAAGIVCDLCLIGGGGNGGASNSSYRLGSGGGGGAYMTNAFNVPVPESVSVTIGAGGGGTTSVTIPGTGTYTAAGGTSGSGNAGGSGGCGGGGGAYSGGSKNGGDGGNGGSNGSNGESGDAGIAGYGDGRSKHPFGDTSLPAYCGGGGGGSRCGSESCGRAGAGGVTGGGAGGQQRGGGDATNYGGGGGGAGDTAVNYPGGKGYQGVVIVRIA